jgi:hypothetical protein
VRLSDVYDLLAEVVRIWVARATASLLAAGLGNGLRPAYPSGPGRLGSVGKLGVGSPGFIVTPPLNPAALPDTLMVRDDAVAEAPVPVVPGTVALAVNR